MTDRPDYAFRARLKLPYQAALERVTDALKAEGFGILTSVDVKATLREKLGATFRKYTILGACNPSLAQKALTEDLEAGLVLPCTLVVYERDGGTSVSIADPVAAVNLLDNPALRAVANEARAKLRRVHERLRPRPDRA